MFVKSTAMPFLCSTASFSETESGLPRVAASWPGCPSSVVPVLRAQLSRRLILQVRKLRTRGDRLEPEQLAARAGWGLQLAGWIGDSLFVPCKRQ